MRKTKNENITISSTCLLGDYGIVMMKYFKILYDQGNHKTNILLQRIKLR